MAVGEQENRALKVSKQLLMSSQLLVHFDPKKRSLWPVMHQGMALEQS